MITRREFHTFVGSTALMSLGGLSAQASNGRDATARLFLGRLTFGATVDEIRAFETLGAGQWLDRQLSKPSMDDHLSERLKNARLLIAYEDGTSNTGAVYGGVSELRPYQYLDGYDPADVLRFRDFDLPIDWQERVRPAREVKHASLTRAVHADAQLREVMTQFWHEHFSVNSNKDENTAIFYPMYDAVMRKHAVGNFRALLGDVARSPAMLYYLNNDASRASPANENFARELLELHTLGAEHYLNDLYDDWRAVPGASDGNARGYIDQDVYEVARAFTGWTVGDGRWLGHGQHAEETGRFAYVEAWHDPYQKRVMGHEFPPNRAAMADGEDVLDILARHPGTAKFVSRKIIRTLGLEAPTDALLDRVAAVFHKAHDASDQIAQVIRAIALDPEFAATPPTKLRRPFEFLAAQYRASGAEVSTTELRFDWFLNRAGWSQHEVRIPTGHSDKSEDWANTRSINALVDMALYAHDDWAEIVDLDVSQIGNADSFAALANHWTRRFGLLEGALDDAFAHLDIDPEDRLPSDPNHLAWATRTMLSLSAVSPAHLFR